MKPMFLALLLGSLATPAFAQDECLPATKVAAGSTVADAPILKTGLPVALTLKAAPMVRYSVPARGTDNARTWGGVAVLMVDKAATWRISLGSGAWIGVAQDGAEIRSTAHQHGEKCVAKMVDFPLKPGKVVIELSAAPATDIRIEAAPVE